jgi:hypothetical protein
MPVAVVTAQPMTRIGWFPGHGPHLVVVQGVPVVQPPPERTAKVAPLPETIERSIPERCTTADVATARTMIGACASVLSCGLSGIDNEDMPTLVVCCTSPCKFNGLTGHAVNCCLCCGCPVCCPWTLHASCVHSCLGVKTPFKYEVCGSTDQQCDWCDTCEDLSDLCFLSSLCSCQLCDSCGLFKLCEHGGGAGDEDDDCCKCVAGACDSCDDCC